MKAKKVNENIDFKRGEPPYKSLGIGAYQELADALEGPFRYQGNIYDANNMCIMKAERSSGMTPLPPHLRDDLTRLTTELLNNFFGYKNAVK